MSWLPNRWPEAPDRKERQRFAERMVERMEQRREGAERAQTEAEGDDAEMLDAADRRATVWRRAGTR